MLMTSEFIKAIMIGFISYFICIVILSDHP